MTGPERKKNIEKKFNAAAQLRWVALFADSSTSRGQIWTQSTPPQALDSRPVRYAHGRYNRISAQMCPTHKLKIDEIGWRRGCCLGLVLMRYRGSFCVLCETCQR